MPLPMLMDPRYYGKIRRSGRPVSAAEVPFLVECDVLTIEGDVRFQKNVTIKGSVYIKNRQGSPAVIEAGTVIDRDLVF